MSAPRPGQSPRSSRLTRLSILRRRELERCAKALGEAKEAEERARELALAAQQKVARAAAQRGELAAAGTSAVDWADMNGWLAAEQKRAELAGARRAAAGRAVTEARARVADAHSRLRRIDALIERLSIEERLHLDQMARKLDDEVAARSALAHRKPRAYDR